MKSEKTHHARERSKKLCKRRCAMKWRKLLAAGALAALLLPACVFPAEKYLGKEIGIGIALGNPTGLTFKNWISRKGAIAGALAWDMGNDNKGYNIHMDYLNHQPMHSLSSRATHSAFYYGIGGRVKEAKDVLGNKNTQVGVRVPMGLSLYTGHTNELFLEGAPVFELQKTANGKTIGIEAAVGFRHFFK